MSASTKLNIGFIPDTLLRDDLSELEVVPTISYAAVPYVSTWLANIRAMADISEQHSESLFYQHLPPSDTLIGKQTSKWGEVESTNDRYSAWFTQRMKLTTGHIRPPKAEEKRSMRVNPFGLLLH